MPGNSNTDQARSARTLPLSRSMVELLGKLMTAIDRRVHMLGDAEDEEYEPDTCAACSGTGFILVPIETFIRVPDEDKEQEDAESAAWQALAASVAGASGNAAAAPTDASADATPVAPGPLASIAPLASVTPVAVAAPVAPTLPVVPSVPPPPAPAPVVVAPALPVPVVPTAALNTQPAVAGPPVTNTVPAESQPIPGFHPLGPNYPVPPPTASVFTNGNADRFYAVTKGIRVGVYGGWQNTSPYVQGVPGASFSRHGTLMAAYTAYVEAHSRGFVVYV